MNERIRELAEQAVNSISDHIDFDIPDVFKEKFAELIVVECMKTCDDLQTQYLTSRKSTTGFHEKNIYAEGEAACDIIKYKMKKQFGVQE